MDNPSLVIIPGMDGTGVFLDGLVSELGDCCDLTVVRYPADLPLGYEELTRVALEFVPEGKPVVLLGESFGGPLALKVAALRAADVRGVLLVASFARYWGGGFRALAPLMRAAPIVAPPARFLRWLLANGRFFAGDAVLRSTLSTLSAAALRRRLEAVLKVDARSEVGSLNVPVLCLRATGDRVVPASAAEEIAATARFGSIVDVPGPHFHGKMRRVDKGICSSCCILTMQSSRRRNRLFAQIVQCRRRGLLRRWISEAVAGRGRAA